MDMANIGTDKEAEVLGNYKNLEQESGRV